MLGPTKIATHHLIVPTQFSMFMNTDYLMQISFAWEKAGEIADKDVLFRQEDCMSMCCVCLTSITLNERIPYQVALRVIGNVHIKSKEWSYDILMCMLCRKCQTSPWHSLLEVDLRNYIPLCRTISENGFKMPISVTLDGTDRDEFNVGKLYLVRFNHLNLLTSIIVDDTIYHGKHYCHHCKKTKSRKNNVKLCTGCESVYFCMEPCRELASIYHDKWLCKNLRKGLLFNVRDTYFISASGQIKKDFLPSCCFFLCIQQRSLCTKYDIPQYIRKET